MKSCTVSHKYGGMSNEELVALAQKGESTALAFLARRFLKVKRAKYPAGYLGIEDLNQEGMLGFLSAVRTYSPDKGAAFDTYASRCIDNRIKTIACRANRKTAASVVIDDCACELYNPLDAISENEKIRELIGILTETLSEKEKKVFGMFIAGFSVSDIAKILKISDKSAENALQRAKRKLRQHYNGAV